MKFLHSKLGANELRLLTPSSRPDGQGLFFSIVHFPRNAAPKYTALSYTWGEGEPSEVIHLNGKIFHVRTNLWSSLHYLGIHAYHSDWKYIWVDAICIDQTNNRERNEQVRLMDQTYRDAACVSVWLGLPPAANQYRSSWPEAIRTFEDDGFCWLDSINDLANRPYWCRFWVIQEFLLAQDIYLFCGGSLVHWMTFKDNLGIAIGVNLYSNEDEDFNASADPNAFNALPLVMGRHPDRHPELPQPLSKLLVRYRRSKCKDPRDKVFALLGLTTWDERRLLARFFPDYTMSEEDVVTITLAHLLQTDPSERISPDDEELFLAFGIRQMEERRWLLRRAEDFDYFSEHAAGSYREMLALHDELEYISALGSYDLSVPFTQKSRSKSGKVFPCLILAIFAGAAFLVMHETYIDGK